MKNLVTAVAMVGLVVAGAAMATAQPVAGDDMPDPNHTAAWAIQMPKEPSRLLWEDFRPKMPADAVKRTNDKYPLSDQANKEGWQKYAPLSDEFNGSALDTKKWYPNNPTWKGRQPAFFWTENVKVVGGNLCLTMRKQEAPEAPKNEGYHDYTSAAVQSKDLVRYGYFEVRAKPMASAGSSSFWFYSQAPDWWTEIDVFEIGGRAPGYERKMNITQHVFVTPAENRHWSIGSVYNAPFDLADDFHVYGVEWDKDEIKFYFDGVLVRKGPNTHWHQPLTLNFDSKTMPDWFGMPKDSDLPSTFQIDYVRAWKKKGQ